MRVETHSVSSPRDPLRARQPAELDHRHAPLGQTLRQRVEELAPTRLRPRRGKDHQALFVLASRAHEVMAEGKRARVDPVQVVDHEQRGLERSQGAMSRFEDAHGLERRARRCAKQKRLEAPAVLGRVNQSSQQTGSRRQGDGSLRLVTGYAKALQHLDPV